MPCHPAVKPPVASDDFPMGGHLGSFPFLFHTQNRAIFVSLSSFLVSRRDGSFRSLGFPSRNGLDRASFFPSATSRPCGVFRATFFLYQVAGSRCRVFSRFLDRRCWRLGFPVSQVVSFCFDLPPTVIPGQASDLGSLPYCLFSCQVNVLDIFRCFPL